MLSPINFHERYRAKFFDGNRTSSSDIRRADILYTKGLERGARSLEQRWQIPTPFLVSSAGDRLSRSSPLSSNPFTTTCRSQPLSTHVQTSTDSRRFFFGVLPRRRRFSPPQRRAAPSRARCRRRRLRVSSFRVSKG